MLEKTLESPLDCKKIKLIYPKVNQPQIVTGRTYAEAEAPVLSPSDVKSQLTGKDPGAGKDWRQEGKVTTEMVGWHHWVSGHELQQTPGDGGGQGSLVCHGMSMGLQRVGHDLVTEQQQQIQGGKIFIE